MRERDEEVAATNRLYHRLARWTDGQSWEGLRDDQLDEGWAEQFGVDLKEPLVSMEASALDEGVYKVMPWHVLGWAAHLIWRSWDLDLNGDAEQAARARTLARLACRDVVRGEASDALVDCQYEFSHGFCCDDAQDYEALCKRHGDIEIADVVDRAVPYRRVRASGLSLLRPRPRVVRMRVSRARRRERRGTSRRSTRGSPARPRPRPSGGDEPHPHDAAAAAVAG